MRKISALIIFFNILCFLPLKLEVIASPHDIQEGSIISDEETEFFILEILNKIFKVTNIKTTPQTNIVLSNEINAFASYGGHVTLYTGLIIKCRNLWHLIAVLAHESGHIAGGHLARMDEAFNGALVPSITTTLIGGLATALSGNASPLMAGIMGGAHILERSTKKHSREEESNADRAALNILGNKAKFQKEFLNIIDSQMFSIVKEYTSTHPGLPYRIRAVRDFIEAHPKKQCSLNIPQNFYSRFRFIQKKLLAFTRKPQFLVSEFSSNTPDDDASQYGRAIYLYRLGKPQQALNVISSLIQKYENNPYFKEIKAQILFEQGKIQESIEYYRQAIHNAPQSRYLKILLSRSVLEQKKITQNELNETIKFLNEVIDKENQNVYLWRLLSKAYGKNNQIPEASACLAEEAWILNNKKLARVKAEQGKRSKNKVLAKRCQDIIQQSKTENG